MTVKITESLIENSTVLCDDLVYKTQKGSVNARMEKEAFSGLS